MDANIKISIIIPVYNADKYLGQCIDSAIAQTISPKEIICIDDGSADHSSEILRGYAKKYDYIHCYAQKNQGAGAARNYGLRLAQGEFVVFLDADDYYLASDALEKMYVACIENGAFICGSFRSREIQGQVLPMDLHRNLFEDCDEKGRWLKYIEYQRDYHYHNYIYSMQMLREGNIVFPNYRRYQDVPFLVNAMIKAEKFYIVPIELYCYRESVQNRERKKTYIADTLRGMIDNLESAVKNNLHILHNLTVSRINDEYYEAIVENAFHNNFEVLDLLRHANQLIHWEWLHNQELNELVPLTEIKEMQIARCFTERCDDNINQLLEILKDKQIIIFGCGNWGTELQDLLEKNGVKICAFCDNSQEKQGKEINGIPVRSLSDAMDHLEAPFFVVASSLYGKDIHRQLTENGVSAENVLVYRRVKYIWN